MAPVRETDAILREAIETGEILSIASHDGSVTGARRQIAPPRVEHDAVVARCYRSGQVKT
jgi:hypothetical protein